MWNVKFLSEAEADMHSLDNSLKKQILKGIAKVSTNPLPIPTGYGKPLGNKGGNNLTRFFKIKYRGIGIRVVYTLVIENCYEVAGKLYNKYGDDIFKDVF